MENIKLPIVIKNDDNNTFLAYCPVFRGCHTFAENKEDLKDYLEETISMYFDLYKSGDKDIFTWDNILYLNFDKDGKITNDFSKEFDKNSLKILS